MSRKQFFNNFITLIKPDPDFEKGGADRGEVEELINEFRYLHKAINSMADPVGRIYDEIKEQDAKTRKQLSRIINIYNAMSHSESKDVRGYAELLLEELCHTFGLEVISGMPGEKYNPKIHTRVHNEMTGDVIAAIHSYGFAYKGVLLSRMVVYTEPEKPERIEPEQEEPKTFKPKTKTTGGNNYDKLYR